MRRRFGIIHLNSADCSPEQIQGKWQGWERNIAEGSAWSGIDQHGGKRGRLLGCTAFALSEPDVFAVGSDPC